MPGFHVEHFGCRVARADGEAISGRLRAAGQHACEPADAELIVVNTCSVTAEADRAARAYIRRAHRKNPDARIVVTGCYAQRAPEELAGLAGVAAVIGNSHKALAPEIAVQLVGGRGQAAEEKIMASESQAEAPAGAEAHSFTDRCCGPTEVVPLLQNLPHRVLPQFPEGSLARDAGFIPTHALLAGAAPVWVDDRFAHSFIEEAPAEIRIGGERQTRPNLKIQEGCGNRCTFCVIPQTRGPSRSLGRAAILRRVEDFVSNGGNELVLSGINLGRWGRDLPAEAGAPRDTLAALVEEIFETTALPRLRLSSIEPMDWDAGLIAVMREHGGTRLARHAHLPLQSGSDGVLRRMHRRYRPWHYAEKISALIDATGPELTLGADVMAGFPGETDAEFGETLAFIRALPFGYLHIFPFSPRPGTPGWQLHAAAPVPPQAVNARLSALRALAEEKMRDHRRKFIGRDLSAITLHTPDALAARGRTAALTENFLPVELEASLPANRLIQVRAGSFSAAESLFCTIQNAA